MKLAQNVRSSFSPAVSTNAAISAVLSLEEGKTKLKRMFYQHLLETSTESLNKDGSEVGVEVFSIASHFAIYHLSLSSGESLRALSPILTSLPSTVD